MNAVAVKVDENDKVDITLEKLNELLKDAYDEGYKAGRDSVPYVSPYVSPLVTPTYPQSPTTPTYPNYPNSPFIYCSIDSNKPCNEPNRTSVNVKDDLTVTGTNFIKNNDNISLS